MISETRRRGETEVDAQAGMSYPSISDTTLDAITVNNWRQNMLSTRYKCIHVRMLKDASTSMLKAFRAKKGESSMAAFLAKNTIR